MNTVIIDENEVIHRGVSDFLANSSFEIVAHCHSLLDYSQVMAGKPMVDLVISEANIGRMGLQQVITMIKKQSGNAKLIIFSEFDDPFLIQQAKYLGADGFIQKSVRSHEFVNRLQDLNKYGNIWNNAAGTPGHAPLPESVTNIGSQKTTGNDFARNLFC